MLEVTAAAGIMPTIQKHGLAVWRGLLSGPLITMLLRYADVNLKNADNYISTKGGVMKADDFISAAPKLDAIFREIWGGEIDYCLSYCNLIIQMPCGAFETHPWHQDKPFLPCDRLVMSWTALVPCGVDAPSISFATVRPDHVIFNHPDAVVRAPDEENAAVMARLNLPTVDLVLDTGDTVFFDEMSVHKSYHTPGMTKDRVAFKLAAYPRWLAA